MANAISGLGGIPPFPSIVPLSEPVDFKDFFQRQLDLERLAFNLHTQASEGVGEQWAPSLHKLAYKISSAAQLVVLQHISA